METIHKIGRRKTSVARIYLKKGKGNFTINSKDWKDYFPHYPHTKNHTPSEPNKSLSSILFKQTHCFTHPLAPQTSFSRHSNTFTDADNSH